MSRKTMNGTESIRHVSQLGTAFSDVEDTSCGNDTKIDLSIEADNSDCNSDEGDIGDENRFPSLNLLLSPKTPLKEPEPNLSEYCVRSGQTPLSLKLKRVNIQSPIIEFKCSSAIYSKNNTVSKSCVYDTSSLTESIVCSPRGPNDFSQLTSNAAGLPQVICSNNANALHAGHEQHFATSTDSFLSNTPPNISCHTNDANKETRLKQQEISDLHLSTVTNNNFTVKTPSLENKVGVGSVLPKNTNLTISPGSKYLRVKLKRNLSTRDHLSSDIKDNVINNFKNEIETVEKCGAYAEKPEESRKDKATGDFILSIKSLLFPGLKANCHDNDSAAFVKPAAITSTSSLLDILSGNASSNLSSPGQEQRLEVKSVQEKCLEVESVQEQRLEVESVQEQRLEGESVQDQRLEVESVQDQRLEVKSVQDQRLEGESVQDQRLEGESVQNQRLEVQTVHDQRLEVESVQDQRLEVEGIQSKADVFFKSNSLLKVIDIDASSSESACLEVKDIINTAALEISVDVLENIQDCVDNQDNSTELFSEVIVDSYINIELPTVIEPLFQHCSDIVVKVPNKIEGAKKCESLQQDSICSEKEITLKYENLEISHLTEANITNPTPSHSQQNKTQTLQNMDVSRPNCSKGNVLQTFTHKTDLGRNESLDESDLDKPSEPYNCLQQSFGEDKIDSSDVSGTLSLASSSLNLGTDGSNLMLNISPKDTEVRTEISCRSMVCSPLLFSDDEDEIENTTSFDPMSQLYSCSSQSVNRSAEQRRLKQIQESLIGVFPPPSVTMPRLGVDDMLRLLKESNEFVTPNLVTDVENQEPCANQLKQPMDCEWPDAKLLSYPDIYYNNGPTSEKFELLSLKFSQRYVGCETASSCNIWSALSSNNSSNMRNKRLGAGHSPGRRLSHLARRRKAFSKDNLIVNNSVPKSQANTVTERRQIVVNKKNDFKTANSQVHNGIIPAIGARPLNHKRALFQSPDSLKKNKTLQTKSNSASKRKLQPNRTADQSFKRALFASGIKNPDLPSSSNQPTQHEEESRRRNRDVGHTAASTSKRKLLFGDSEASTSGCSQKRGASLSSVQSAAKRKERVVANTSSTCVSRSVPGSVLTSAHKKKLLWAIAEALRGKGINIRHKMFKTYAQSLARVCRTLLSDALKSTHGSTSEIMLQLANQQVTNIISSNVGGDLI